MKTGRPKKIIELNAALSILENEPEGLSISELARRLGMARNTAAKRLEEFVEARHLCRELRAIVHGNQWVYWAGETPPPLPPKIDLSEKRQTARSTSKVVLSPTSEKSKRGLLRPHTESRLDDLWNEIRMAREQQPPWKAPAA